MVTLEEIYRKALKTEKINLTQLANPDNHEFGISLLSTLWRMNAYFAVNALVAENNIEKFKEYCNVCGLLDEYVILRHNSRLIEYATDHITFAILSDNSSMIDRYSKLRSPYYENSRKKGSIVHTIQFILQDNFELLEKDIETFKILTTKQSGKVFLPDLLFFEGYKLQDVNMMTDAIFQLLKAHNRRNKEMGIIKNYISIPALTYTKLAWMKGIEIDIDHPLIPREILPIRQLQVYPVAYPFLR